MRKGSKIICFKNGVCQGVAYEDIYDGEKYKTLQANGWFNEFSDIGLLLSTDGGALFKSSGVEAWPVWGVNLNLEPALRIVLESIVTSIFINYNYFI